MGPAFVPALLFWERSMPRLTEYKDMSPRAKAVVEDIAKRRNIDPATWPYFARATQSISRSNGPNQPAWPRNIRAGLYALKYSA